MNLRNLIVVAIAALLLGCGSREPRLATIRVQGTLYLDDKVFGPALLQLTPDPPNESMPVVNAYVKKDGSFELRTYKDGDGAPAGKYNVILSMDPIAMGPVPATKRMTVDVAEMPGTSVQTIDVKLESSGGEMISPLPPPGQEGGRRGAQGMTSPGGGP